MSEESATRDVYAPLIVGIIKTDDCTSSRVIEGKYKQACKCEALQSLHCVAGSREIQCGVCHTPFTLLPPETK